MKARIGVMIASALLAAATTASAQQMVMGLQGGATYSDMENPDSPESRWGFTGGLIFGVSTTRSVSLLEVSYTQKGDGDHRSDWIELGLTGGAAVGSPSGARGRFYGGITVNFPVACEGTTVATNLFCNEDVIKTDWGAPLGLMLGRWSPSGAFIGIDARYTFPLSDAGGEWYNNVWTFRLIIGRAKTRR